MIINKEKLKEHKENLKRLQTDSRALKILKKLFELNKKDPKRINDNLIKLVADLELLQSA